MELCESQVVWALRNPHKTLDTKPKTQLWAHQDSHSKPTRKEIKQLWPEARETLEYLGRYLPKQRLVRAINLLSEARKRRFLRRRIPKYGAMNKGFTEQELLKFLSMLEEPRFVLLFTFQAILGLRISEVVRIHVKDINLTTKELTIHNIKCDRIDTLPLPSQLFEQVLRHIQDYEEDIVQRKGYLFWAENYPERNDCPYVSTNHARNIFQKAVEKAKMNETYGIADGTTPRLLHRLTTHSLRHYAVTNFARKNNGNVVLTSKFARHTSLETTMIYIHTEKDELNRGMMLAQDDGILEKVRRIQGNVK